MNRIFIIMILLALSLAQTKYELRDGTVIVGDIVSQSETEIVINTEHGEVTILKSKILIKNYTIEMNTGETLHGEKISEAKIKEDTKATIRCILTEEKAEGINCIYSGNPAKHIVIFAKAY